MHPDHQNPIDPCVFMLVDAGEKDEKRVRGLLLTHVDDLMLLTEPKIQPIVHRELKERFPIEEWEVSNFEYVGCEFECHPEYINITQVTYMPRTGSTRLTSSPTRRTTTWPPVNR